MKKVFVTLLMFLSITVLFSEDLIASLGPEIMAINEDMPQLIEEAIKKSGHNVTIISRPAGRSLEHFKSGDHHLELRVPSFGQQNDFVTPIKTPVSKLTIKAFVNKSLNLTEVKDLKGKKFTSVHGLVLNDVVMAKIPDLELNLLRDFKAVPQYVAAGRSDFFVQEEFAGKNYLKETKTEDKIVVLDENVMEIPLLLFVHNDKAHIIKDLEPILESMIQEGRFK